MKKPAKKQIKSKTQKRLSFLKKRVFLNPVDVIDYVGNNEIYE